MGGETEPDVDGPWRLEGLAAFGAEPEHAREPGLFGQFVGDWEISEWRNLEKDGHWTSGKGELHWRWILGGRAVQDVWEVVDPATGRSVPLVPTVRFYNPTIDARHSVWMSPENHAVRTFIGRRVGEEIVLGGMDSAGHPIRWIFSEIPAESFRWRGEVRSSERSEGSMNEEMRVRRRAPE